MNRWMDEITSNINGLLFVATLFYVSLLYIFGVLNHFNVDSISMIDSNTLILSKSKKYLYE